MNRYIIDGITRIDPELIEKYLYNKMKLQIQKKQHRAFRLTTTVIAACFLVAMCLTFVIQYIPEIYDLDYYPVHDDRDYSAKKKSVWIYYAGNFDIKRERVYLPNYYYGRFVAWKYLSGIGEDVVLVDYKLAEHPIDSSIYEGKKHYHYSLGVSDEHQYIVYITLSPDIINYLSKEKEKDLMLSLQKTIIQSNKLNISDVFIIIDNKILIRKDASQ